jgi:aminoglycoside 6-adenylyltransferase
MDDKMANQIGTKTNRLYEQLLERFVKLAETRSDISAVIIVGSRARRDHPADEWADLDVIVVTTDPERYLSTTDWLEGMGKPLLTFLEPTATGGQMERRVLFEGMLDVDFSIIPKRIVEQLQNKIPPQIAEIFSRGTRVLVDKDGMAAQFLVHISSAEPLYPSPPSEHEFLEVIYDCLYHAVWTVKKLRRGELWTAKFCLDSYMKSRCMLPIMEWHARAVKGRTYDTCHNGRFLEEWADPCILEGLRGTFAHYDEADIKRGLLATMDLFRKIAMKIAEKLGYLYPIELDKQVTEWTRTHLSKR